MSIAGSIILLLTGLGAIAWWRLLKGKELARITAAKACREHGLVLMDDTVMLDAVQLKKEDPVRAWGFRYRFDFVHRGIRRHGGTVLISPGRRPTVIIETDNGPVVQEF